MPEPLTTTVLIGAAGAGAGKLIERAWDSGQRWLSDFYKDHQTEAREAASINAGDFLQELAQRVNEVEMRNSQNKDKIDAALKEPSFSVLLQKAILNSAQTSDKGKHQLLSKLVAEKLQVKAESTQALASQMACDAITYATERQLRILGLIFALGYRAPVMNMPNLLQSTNVLEDMFYAGCDSYAQMFVGPLLVDDFSHVDLLHLEALSCIKVLSFTARHLGVKEWKAGGYQYNEERFFETEVGKRAKPLWIKGLQTAELTSVGMLVGMYVVENVTKGTTSLGDDWTL